MIIIEALLFSYLTFAVLHTLVFAIAGTFTPSPLKAISSKENIIAILIPAYKEDKVIVHTAQKALQQNYPSAKFTVVIIADTLENTTLSLLAELPLKVISVSFEESTKAKALNAAMEQISDKYDIAIVLDADNIIEEDFLSKINKAFNAGYAAVQGRRVGKNLNSPFAVLDAISEVINNHIFRKGHTNLGLSSAIIGSGMAFDYKLFKGALKNSKAVGGFDRELQLSFISKRRKILYLEDAIIFDEKTERASTFSNQRKRWLASQAVYLKKNFLKGFGHLVRGNYDFFNMAILNNILFPRILLLGFLTIIGALAFLFKANITIPYYVWVGLLGLYILTFILSIPIKLYNKKLAAAIVYLPKAFFIMFLSLFKLRGANQRFIHTPHTHVDVDKSLIN